MYYTIYKVTNKINGKFYIGKHKTKELEDGYMGSGNLIKRAIKKYGKENFTKEILHVFETEAAMDTREKELVVVSEQSYNLCEGGKGGFGYINKTRDHHLHNLKVASVRTYREPKLLEWLKSDRKKEILRSLHKQGKIKPPNTTGYKHTEETKKIIGKKNSRMVGKLNSQFGTCWITNGEVNKKIKNDELDNWISLGYKKGRIPT